ncbi:hypothetical protein [Rhodococcus sp. T7]|uniref:hypothetical protein n=1 Tax=Rhodococcus sp. T7 TaxID=627444 RepID=UPI001F1BF338|nr:hypothetical protein [Rhodococcus sp. T7]
MTQEHGRPQATGEHRPLASTFRSPAARSVEHIASQYIEGSDDVEVEPNREAPPERGSVADADGGGKSSSVRVPAKCHAKLEQLREQTGMTNGQIFIVAIEATHERLPELLYPGGRIGGGLFAPRGIRPKSSRDDSETQVTYRLFKSDFDVIDQLVVDLAAKSRSHLITAALTGYFFGDDERTQAAE